MNRLFTLSVNATSNNITVIEEIEVRVFDKNRPPVIDIIPDTINVIT